MHSVRGRASIRAKYLLRVLVIQILYRVSPGRHLVEQIDFNLLFRWLIGLSVEDGRRDAVTFSHNRERLFDEGMAR